MLIHAKSNNRNHRKRVAYARLKQQSESSEKRCIRTLKVTVTVIRKRGLRTLKTTVAVIRKEMLTHAKSCNIRGRDVYEC